MWWWLAISVASAQEEPVPPSSLVKGLVVEYGSGLPIGGATVEIALPTGQTVVQRADESGSFEIETPPGTLSLSITAPTHQAGEFVETIGANKSIRVKYRLERYSWRSNEEVVVYGETRDEVARTVISVEELRRIPGSFGDPIRALQSLPSVTRGPDLSGDIVARGAEAINTAAHVDEIRIPFLFHFLAGRSVVEPGLLQDIEFYPGAVPPRYGNVSQAVINARTRFDRAEPGLHGRVHADLLEFGWSLAANLDNDWTIRFGGRRAWIGSLVNAGLSVARAVQNRNDPAFRPASLRFPYRDSQLRVVRHMGRDRLSFTVLSARDGIELIPERIDLDGDGRHDPPPASDLPYDNNVLLDNRFVRAQLRWDRTTEHGLISTWGTVGRDSQQNLVPGLGLVGQTSLQFASLERGWVSFGHDGIYPLGKQAKLHLGGEMTIQPGQITNLASPDLETTRAVRLWAGPFGEAILTPGKWRLAPGFRLSVHQLLDGPTVVPEPRMSARYNINDIWSAVGYVGVLSQGPTLQQAGTGFVQGKLGVVKAVQSTLGVEARWPNGWGLDVNVYETEMFDLAVRDTQFSVAPDPAGANNFNVVLQTPFYEEQRGRAFGLEAQLRLMPRGPTFGWVAGAVGRSFRFRPDGTRVLANADVPFNLVVVAGHGLPKEWTISGRAPAVQRPRVYPVDG